MTNTHETCSFGDSRESRTAGQITGIYLCVNKAVFMDTMVQKFPIDVGTDGVKTLPAVRLYEFDITDRIDDNEAMKIKDIVQIQKLTYCHSCQHYKKR